MEIEYPAFNSKFDEVKLRDAGHSFSYDEMCVIVPAEAPKVEVSVGIPSSISVASVASDRSDPSFRLRIITKL
jgi:hypothetical protein